MIDGIIEELEKEIEEFETYREVENSSLGGNTVKAAMYGGHVAGLRSALDRILCYQHDSERGLSS